MKPNPPRTPFSTPLSGSARERKLRLVSIFQWKKKRPPLPLLCLCLCAGLLCGGLAACQSQPAPKAGSASSEASSDTSSQSPERLILEALAPYAQGLEEDSKTSISYLLQEDEDRYFGAGRYSSGERYSLVIGLVNPDGTVAGSPFETGAYGGRPYLQTFWKDGQKYLLYTATGMQTGLSWGEAGLIRMDADDFTWVWPVEGDIRDKASSAYEEYQNYWTGRLPLMAPGGVEIFVDSGYDVLRGEGPQWVPDHNEQFFPSDYDTLPIPVPCQVRVWLEDYTVQAEGNPWEMDNASAAWQITSLKADDQVYPGQSDTEQAYTLEAQAENGSGETLTAILLFDQEEGKVTRDVEVIWGSDNTQEAAPLTLDDAFAPHAPLTHQEAPAMLENLTLEDFPTQPIDLLDWANWEGWENLVYLLREDKATDTALYGVVEEADPDGKVPSAPMGLILRHGSHWRFHPLDWSGSQWEGVAPELFVGDFNGDGRLEAALSILVGHGTGFSTYSLTLFDLNTLERSDLDGSTLSLTVVYDPGTCRALLDTGKQQAVVNLRDYTIQYGAFTGTGSGICSYTLEDGVLWGSYSLYFTFEDLPPTLAYLVDVRAPVVCVEGQWQLGEGNFLRQNCYNWENGLESIQWTGEAADTHIARSQEELLAAS